MYSYLYSVIYFLYKVNNDNLLLTPPQDTHTLNKQKTSKRTKPLPYTATYLGSMSKNSSS